MAALRSGRGPVVSWIRRYDKLMADKMKIIEDFESKLDNFMKNSLYYACKEKQNG